MADIINTSFITDYSGEPPSVMGSNPVTTTVIPPDPPDCCDCCDCCNRCDCRDCNRRCDFCSLLGSIFGFGNRRCQRCNRRDCCENDCRDDLCDDYGYDCDCD